MDDSSSNSRLAVLLTALVLLVPGFSALVLAGLTAADEPAWPQFGQNGANTGEALPVDRGFPSFDDKPVKVFDFGHGIADDEYVVSWSAAVGNLTPNIVVAGNGCNDYDREVQHVAYVVAEDTGDNNFRAYLEIREAGHKGDLMWRRDLGLLQDSSGRDIAAGQIEDRWVGVSTPTLVDVDLDGRIEVVYADPDGNVTFFEPIITYNCETGNYGGGDENNGTVIKHKVDIYFAWTNPTFANLTGDAKPEVILSGVTLSGAGDINGFAVTALEHDGTPVFRYTRSLTNTAVSSPAVMVEGVNTYIFVSAYVSGDLKVYGLDNDGNTITGWNGNRVRQAIKDPQSAQNDNHPMLPSPVVADVVPADEGEEIIIASPGQETTNEGAVQVFKLDGTEATGWPNPQTVSRNNDGGDIDATPVVGDIDNDDKPEIVVLYWADDTSGGSGAGEEFGVAAFDGEDGTSSPWTDPNHDLDTDSGSTLYDDGEHAIGTPALVDFNADGALDVILAVTPRIFGLDGTDGSAQFNYDLAPSRDEDNRIFDSVVAGEFNSDGMTDFFVSGALFSGNLTDQTLQTEDLVFSQNAQTVTQSDEGEAVDVDVTIHNQGTRDAEDVEIEYYEEFQGQEELLHTVPNIDIQADTTAHLPTYQWTPSTTGNVNLTVRILFEAGTPEQNKRNPELRYDNNNASRTLHIWASHGVELLPDGGSNTTQAGDPGENVTWDLAGHNLARGTDNFTLELFWEDQQARPNSSADRVLYEMKGNESRGFTLNVTIPEDEAAGTKTFTLRATSEGNASRTGALELELEVLPVYNFSVQLIENRLPFVPGQERYFRFQLANHGNTQETFDFSSQGSGGAHWTHEAPANGERVEAGQDKILDLVMTAPAVGDTEYGETYVVELTVAARTGDTERSLNLTGVMQQSVVEPAAQATDMGTNATYNLTVYNLIKGSDNQTFRVEVKNNPDWEYGFQGDDQYLEFMLEAGESLTLKFNVSVPADADPAEQDLHNVSVQAQPSGVEDYHLITTTAQELEGLRLNWGNPGLPANSKRDRGEELGPFKLVMLNYEEEALEVTMSMVNFPLAEGWEYGFTNEYKATHSFVMGAGSSGSPTQVAENFYLNVSQTASDGDKKNFRVRLTSDDGRYSQELWFRIAVNPDYGVRITSQTPRGILVTNLSQSFGFNITNTGNGNDFQKVNVSFTGPQSWLKAYKGTLDLGQDATEQLEVKLEPDLTLTQFEQYYLNVTVDSQYGRDAGEPSVDTSSMVLEGRVLRMDDPVNRSAPPNETVTYHFTVANPDAQERWYYFELEQGSEDTGDLESSWRAYFHSGGVNLSAPGNKQYHPGAAQELPAVYLLAGETTGVELTLRASPGHEVGPVAFVLTMWPESGMGLDTEPWNLTIEVEQVYALSILVESPVPEITRGGQVTVSAMLTNLGNGPDSFEITAGIVDAVGWTLTPQTPLVTELAGNGGERELAFTMQAAAEIERAFGPPQAYTLWVAAGSMGGPGLEENDIFQASVTPEYNFVLGFTDNLTTRQGEAGEAVAFYFNVTNQGNVEDVFDIVIDDTGALTEPPTLHKQVMTIAAQGSARNYVIARVPTTGEGPWDLALTVSSRNLSGNPVQQVLTLQLDELRINLRIAAFELDPDPPIEGEVFQLSTVMYSTGENVAGVLIHIMVDGELAASKVMDLRQDTTGEMQLIATLAGLSKGTHNITVILDPKNEVLEEDETDNQLPNSIIVVAKPDHGGGGAALIVILLIVVIALGLGYYIYDQRREVDEGAPDKYSGVKPSSAGEAFPVVLNCPGCGVKIKVNKPGGFRCPACKTIGKVNEQGEFAKEGEPETVTQGPGTPPAGTEAPSTTSAPSPEPTQTAAGAVAATSATEAAPESKTKAKGRARVKGKTKGKRVEQVQFPVIINCLGCQARVRVKEPGKFRCPACKTMARVTRSGEMKALEQAGTAPDSPQVTFPLSVSCPQCQAGIKVPKAGKFRCPACTTVSKVLDSGEVVDKDFKPPTAEDEFDWGDDDWGQQEEASPETAPESSPVAGTAGQTLVAPSPQASEVPDIPPPPATPPEFPVDLPCPTCGANVRAPKPCRFKCPKCQNIGMITARGQVLSETQADQARKAAQEAIQQALTPQAVMRNFQTYLHVTPEVAQQLYSAGFTTLRTVRNATQEQLEATLPQLTSIQLKRIRMDIRFLDIDRMEGTATMAAAALGEVDDAPRPKAQPTEMACAHCQTYVQIQAPGMFRCPTCMKVSQLNPEGSVQAIDETALASRTTAQTDPPSETGEASPTGTGSTSQAPFQLPATVACGQCQTPVQVSAVGPFRCPACMSVSELAVNGRVALTEAPAAVPPASETSLSASCAACGTNIKIPKAGKFRCPSCKAISKVDGTGSVELVKAAPEAEASQTPALSPGTARTAAKPKGPLQVACGSCGSKVKVAQAGKFRCPGCKAISKVDAAGKVELVKAATRKQADHERETDREAAEQETEVDQKARAKRAARKKEEERKAREQLEKAVSRGPGIGGF